MKPITPRPTKAQPMIDSVQLCAQFLGMGWGGAFWCKGGPPQTVQADTQGVAALREAFRNPQKETA